MSAEIEASQFFGYFTTAIAGLAGTIVTLGGTLVYLVKGILLKHETSQEATLSSHKHIVDALVETFRKEVDGCKQEREKSNQALLHAQQNMVDFLTGKLIESQALCPPEGLQYPTQATTTTTQRS